MKNYPEPGVHFVSPATLAVALGLQDGEEIRFWPNARASRAAFKLQRA